MGRKQIENGKTENQRTHKDQTNAILDDRRRKRKKPTLSSVYTRIYLNMAREGETAKEIIG